MPALPQSRILVIDDEEYFRLFLSSLFEKEEIEVFSYARGSDAFRQLQEETYDLIIIDYQLPDMLGMEVLDWLREHNVSTPRIMVTAYGSIDIAVQALKKGAADFFTKPLADPEAFVRFLNRALSQKTRPIEATKSGERPAAAPQRASSTIQSPATEITPARVRELCAQYQPPISISRREYEVIAALLRGLSNKEIASNLYISERTVKNHLTSIYRKFNVDGRSQLFNRLLLSAAS